MSFAATPPPSLPPGLRVTLSGEKITHGGMCHGVYPGKCDADGRAVVVKIQPLANGLHEAGVLLRLHTTGPHPHIIGFVDHQIHQGRSYLVMEHAQGGDWFDRLNDNGRMSEADVMLHFRQVLDAVRFMHAHGVAHRDLKLENIALRKVRLCTPNQTCTPARYRPLPALAGRYGRHNRLWVGQPKG